MSRIERKVLIENKIKQYLESEIATDDSLIMVEELFNLIEKKITQVKENNKSIRFGKIEKKFNNQLLNNYINIICMGIDLIFHWHLESGNRLHGSSLDAIIYKRERYLERDRKILKKTQYDYSMNSIDEKGWKEKNTNDFLSSEEIAELWLKELVNIATKFNHPE